MSRIRVYVEGGGDKKEQKQKIRIGFSAFLEEIRAQDARRRSVRVTACGSRDRAFKAFCSALRNNPNDFIVLLVDSEEPVRSGDTPWRHLCSRDSHWQRDDPQVPDDRYHLMAQTMEAWFIADPATLQSYYGHDYNANPIPQTNDVEQIDKDTLGNALHAATRRTQKGPYHKINHASDLLQLINPDTVRQRASHCARLFRVLSRVR